MSNYALIKDGVVVNVIVADDQETANLFGTAVEYTDSKPAGIGWTYDGTSFKAPVVQETNPPA
jgi:flavin reductase (DIM6/NTAB) family NADH-FMN oxidoreductase RutF